MARLKPHDYTQRTADFLLTISVGLAVDLHGQNGEQLLVNGDPALYQAKHE